MAERHRAKSTPPLKDRLAAFAEEARSQASQLHAGPEKEDLLNKARQADTAAQLDAWANSAGLRPPD
jgi:hypothetical protein